MCSWRGGELTIRVLPGKQPADDRRCRDRVRGHDRSVNKNPLSRLTAPALPSGELASSECEMTERVAPIKEARESIMKMNKHYNELKASYLFVDIAHKVAAYQEAHPEKEIIRLGIGDVTQPLAKCVVQAMRDAAAEMGTKEGFHGYGPEQGYPFLKQAIQATTPAAAPRSPRTKSLSRTAQRATLQTCWVCSMWTTPCWYRTPCTLPM